MEDNNNIIERIKNQKKAFINWNTELKKELSEETKNPIKSIQLYLIQYVWLKNYEQIFFNGPKENNNLIKSYKNLKLINNDNLFKATTIKDLPRVYPLNKNCWLNFIRNKDKENELIFEGIFYNKILIFKLIILNNCNIY